MNTQRAYQNNVQIEPSEVNIQIKPTQNEKNRTEKVLNLYCDYVTAVINGAIASTCSKYT